MFRPGLNDLRMRATERDQAASEGRLGGPFPDQFASLESSSLSGDGATTPQDDRIWRKVQQRINAEEEQRALLNQHVVKAERTLAAAVTFQRDIYRAPARLGMPEATTEELIERVRALVAAQVKADEDGRCHLKDAVASTHKELWCSVLQVQ